MQVQRVAVVARRDGLPRQVVVVADAEALGADELRRQRARHPVHTRHAADGPRGDGAGGRHALGDGREGADPPPRRRAEDGRGDGAAAVAVGRVVEHDGEHDLGGLDGEHAHERGPVRPRVAAADGALGGARLARHAQPGDARQRRRALRADHVLEEGHQAPGRVLAEGAANRVRLDLPEHAPGRRVAPLVDDVGADEQAAVGERAVGHGELKRGHLDAVAAAHGGQRGAAPVLGLAERPGDLTRHIHEGRLAEAEVAGGLVERPRPDPFGRLGHRDVGRLGDGLRERNPAVAMGVLHRPPVEDAPALAGVEHVARCDGAALQRRDGGDELERRARLDAVHDGVVAAGGVRVRAGAVGVIGGHVGHRKDGSRVGVERDGSAPGCARLGDAAGQLLLQDGLPHQIDGQHHVVAVLRLHARPADHRADDAAAVALDGLAAGRTLERVVERHLQPGDAVEVAGDVAEHVCRARAVVVAPPVRPAHDQPAEVARVEGLLGGLVEVAHQHHVLAAGPVGDARPVVLGARARQLAQERVQFARPRLEARHRGVGRDLVPRRVDDERPPTPVEDGAPLRSQLDHALRLALALRTQLLALAHVDLHQLPDHEDRKNQEHHEDDVEPGENGVASGDDRAGKR